MDIKIFLTPIGFDPKLKRLDLGRLVQRPFTAKATNCHEPVAYKYNRFFRKRKSL